MVSSEPAGWAVRRGLAAWLCVGIGCSLLITSCGGARITLRYPREGGDYTGLRPATLPRVYLGSVEDRRPDVQKNGAGRFVGITFPADRTLEIPVDVLYREALAQDIAETGLAELVPLPRQAAYHLHAEVFSFTCHLQRQPMSFVLPAIGGMMAGMVFGKTDSDRVKTGAVLAIAALMAVPVPADVRGEVEVRLTLHDERGVVVWRQTCRGELSERRYLTATSRDDKKLAETYLPRAIKRANACLLGQLRHFLSVAQPVDEAPSGG